MISLQQYRSSIGCFRTLSHREAKVVWNERKVKREARTAVLMLLLYLILAAGMGELQDQVSKLKRNQYTARKYQDMNQRQIYASVLYHPTSKSLNKIMHMKNRNRGGKGHPMTLCYWNKGAADLENKSESIAKIVRDYKPHVLGIGEA